MARAPVVGETEPRVRHAYHTAYQRKRRNVPSPTLRKPPRSEHVKKNVISPPLEARRTRPHHPRIAAARERWAPPAPTMPHRCHAGGRSGGAPRAKGAPGARSGGGASWRREPSP